MNELGSFILFHLTHVVLLVGICLGFSKRLEILHAVHFGIAFRCRDIELAAFLWLHFLQVVQRILVSSDEVFLEAWQ